VLLSVLLASYRRELTTNCEYRLPIPFATLLLTIRRSDIGMWARSFGAKISPILSKSTTHVVAHKDRRTSKVRQAARYPNIQIVAVSWLLQCFTQWAHVDEEPHLTLIEREEHGSHDSLPFDDLEDGVILTPSENGGEDGVLPDGNEVLLSPIADQVDWGGLDEEFHDFFGDLDGDETEDGGEESDRESGAESDASTKSTSSRRGKRKRRTTSVDGTEDSEDLANGRLGSELQKRKKRALERTTGLANVSSADNPSGLPSPDTTGPEEDAEKQPVNGDNSDDEAEDDFEREMMAEFERQSNEPEEA
jgi:RNA polymerase II subunit A-like phosphatase